MPKLNIPHVCSAHINAVMMSSFLYGLRERTIAVAKQGGISAQALKFKDKGKFVERQDLFIYRCGESELNFYKLIQKGLRINKIVKCVHNCSTL